MEINKTTTALSRNGIFLSNFRIIRPPHERPQAELNRWILKRHLASREIQPPDDDMSSAQYEKIHQRYAIKDGLIAKRAFECADVTNPDFTDARIYPVGLAQLPGADIGVRTQFYSERAQAVMTEFYERAERVPSHIVHVTCTGYRSPSAAQLLIARKGWGSRVGVTHAYHMGCYASLPAVRIAEGLLGARAAFTDSAQDYKVDIVHTEMCGLHMNAAANTAEQIVVQSLFADGHIKYTASLDTEGYAGYRVLAVKEMLVADSEKDMSWSPESWGLQMNLSREVPEKIRAGIHAFFEDLAGQAGLDVQDLLGKAVFAIHPGGPKIIQSVQEILKLSDSQTQNSKRVLFERGNMSSATLPHVWSEILDGTPPSGTKVVSFAFGPGLTIFGSVFEVI